MPRRTQFLVVVVFVLVGFVPATVAATGLVRPTSFENRPLTPRPSSSPKALLHSETYKALTDFLTDRLPWRNRAIRAREVISTSLFDETSSESIVAGPDGWLFVAAPLREPCVPAEEMARLRSQLQAMAELFQRAEKQFRLLVVPDKSIVYAQRVPPRDLRASCATANSLALRDAIGGLAPGYSTVAEVARRGPDLYYKGDEHWNARGALLASAELVDVLQPGLFDLSPYRFVPDGEVRSDNLARYQGEARTEVADSLVVDRSPVEVVLSDRTGSVPGALILHEKRTGGPLVPAPVLVVHDSFGVALQPLVSPWLADVTWLGIVAGRFDPPALSRAFSAADTVVLVVVERNLGARIDALLAAANVALGA